jgi:hypothetical protein
MTKTITARLRETCHAKGYKSTGGPDEPVSAPAATKWWACVYDPATGHIAALVTAAHGAPKTVRRRLLNALDHPAPTIRKVRRGTVVLSSSRRSERGVRDASRILVEFDDGAREILPHPLMVPVRPGWPVKEVEFEGHEGPLVLWGPEHMPQRLTQHRANRKTVVRDV